jgi:hypothetical protein
MLPAMDAVRRALVAAVTRREKFDALLCRARLEAGMAQDHAAALETYWTARRTARAGDESEQIALADLGIGMSYISLDRVNEGLEAILRVVRSGQRMGNLLLRGCAELLLGEHEMRIGKLDAAHRRVAVAMDLLGASGSTDLVARARQVMNEVEAKKQACATSAAAQPAEPSRKARAAAPKAKARPVNIATSQVVLRSA